MIAVGIRRGGSDRGLNVEVWKFENLKMGIQDKVYV